MKNEHDWNDNMSLIEVALAICVFALAITTGYLLLIIGG